MNMFSYTAFDGFELISQGKIQDVAFEVKKRFKANHQARILIFSDATGRQIDIDLSGTDKEMHERLRIYDSVESSVRTGAGRPKLGVKPREISLLPQHWEWLINQEGGASSTIRRLIDEKMKTALSGKETIKKSQEVTYKFLTSIAGDLPQFEEAIRFLYRQDKKKFKGLISSWPPDLVKHALYLSKDAFE